MSGFETSSPSAIKGLIDRGVLNGQFEVTTILRPERSARLVPTGDPETLRQEILRLCQVWGGACQPFIPVDGGRIPDVYERLLCVEQIDFVGGLTEVEISLPPRVRARYPSDHPALLIAAHERMDRRRPVRVTELDATDPWRPIYDVMLGAWPDTPDSVLSEQAGLRDDLTFEDVVPVERVTVKGSLADLIERLMSSDALNPRDASIHGLAHGLNPDTSFFGTDPILPNPRSVERAAGPNIIVAVTAGSVDDLALLWNLRGAHGSHRVLPIGIPIGELDNASLEELQTPGRATMFGFGGGKCYLVSASVPMAQLRSVADESASVRVSNYEPLLQIGPAPGRHRSQVATWDSGVARLEPQSESDREILSQSQSVLRKPRLVLDVRVGRRPLPTDRTMRGDEWYGRYQAGAAQCQVSELTGEGTVEVRWPSTWTCLAAVAQTNGLQVVESEPGLAASTLIRSIGSVSEVRHLLHQPLIDLLYRLAERSGMAWQKKRLKETIGRLETEGRDRAELEQQVADLGLSEPVVAPSGEGRAAPFGDFSTALGSQAAARHWIAWAERRHLLVRGADITCPDCKAKSWLPLAALPPPVPCAGCGREIAHPYEPEALKFTYRLGEPLRRVLETDSLGHVLALHWFVSLFSTRGLVGAHPGAAFVDPSDPGKTIGEADVALLFTNGTIVPVEVKRTIAGVDVPTIKKMDLLADALDAPWDGLVVSQPARDALSLASKIRVAPDRPRFVVTDDQVHEQRVFWALGGNPFGWDPMTEEALGERRRAFGKGLAEHDPDASWDPVNEYLLRHNDE